MAAGKTGTLPVRRCCACSQLYQRTPAVYTPTQQGLSAEWKALRCAACGVDVWYPVRSDSSCVCCWACQHTTAIASDDGRGPPSSPAAAPSRGFLSWFRWGGSAAATSASEPTQRDIVTAAASAATEGLCRGCTLRLSGLSPEDLRASGAVAASLDAKDADEDRHGRSNRSPTSIDACLHVLGITEVIARDSIVEEAKAERVAALQECGFAYDSLEPAEAAAPAQPPHDDSAQPPREVELTAQRAEAADAAPAAVAAAAAHDSTVSILETGGAELPADTGYSSEEV
eukprot:TRINITY_DN13956_c0_g4_i2.p2 TRINITY_DN13956_c0_g4~~TRINITY_DN13956_c0_g4_i2.p2  ORF type:complete len:286 (+),score=71.06 TRINITY_DN13956_c0_g4_i2:79-936(+)